MQDFLTGILRKKIFVYFTKVGRAQSIPEVEKTGGLYRKITYFILENCIDKDPGKISIDIKKRFFF